MDEDKNASGAAASQTGSPAQAANPVAKTSQTKEDSREQAGPPDASADASASDESKFVDLVEQWWNEHFPGSAVGHVTEAWNVAFRAKEDLKRRLKAL